jgi:hypothetical protein
LPVYSFGYYFPIAGHGIMAKTKLTEEIVDKIERALEERKPSTDRRKAPAARAVNTAKVKEQRSGKDRRGS